MRIVITTRSILCDVVTITTDVCIVTDSTKTVTRRDGHDTGVPIGESSSQKEGAGLGYVRKHDGRPNE